MQRASAKAKGKAHERDTARFYRHAGFAARRTPSSGAMVDFPGDVMGAGPFVVECKADERLSVWAAIKQAEAAAGPGTGGLAVVHMRRSNGRGQRPTRIVAMPEWVWGWVLDKVKWVDLG